MAKKNWREKLAALDGAVKEYKDPHLRVVRSGSPSVNALFGNSGSPNRGWGLPRKFSALIGGPPKGGKSTLVNSIVGQFQRDYPEAVVIKIDTEIKEQAQTSMKDLAKWGIDLERYMCYERSDPQVIDLITGSILKLVQDGLPLGLLVVDCFNAIDGFRGSEKDKAEDANKQIGDNARTCQMLMNRVVPILREHDISFIGTAHVGAEMDPLEQKRGHKVRVKTSYGTNHRIEYWLFVERDFTVAGRKDLQEREFIRETSLRSGKDGRSQDVYAHKIKVEMLGSSFGPPGREASFTYDYEKGIVNTHEEVFTMAKANGLIVVGGGGVYTYGEKSIKGLGNFLDMMEKDPALCRKMLDELMIRDAGGERALSAT